MWEALERAGDRSAACALTHALYPRRSALHKRSRIGELAGEEDFPDAERLVKRLVAQELTLSFVPDRTAAVADRDAPQVLRSRAAACNSTTG